MSGERTVPLLPCRSVDEIAEFYAMLGFVPVHRQTRPNPYVALRREDLHLHFFGLPGLDPAESYGTCLVAVPDPGELFAAFAAGMRAAHGKLLVSGIPRMTRPRKRKNSDDATGFTVVDPAGNWIRIIADAPAAPAAEPEGKLAATLRSAVVQGDSRGDDRQAARLLDSALRKHRETAAPADLLEALAYRAELAARAGDPAATLDFLAQAREIPLAAADRDALAATFAALDDLERGCAPTLPS